jgi:hypothetical protein
MGLYDSMKTSPRLESEGIWLDLDHTRIKLARAGGKNTKFIVAAEKIAREHKRAFDLMGEEQGRKIFSKLFAEIVVLDWLTKAKDGDLDEDGLPFAENEQEDAVRYLRGISGPDGVLVDFTVENVIRTFNDLPDLLKMVKETAEDATLFRQSLLKGIEGN